MQEENSVVIIDADFLSSFLKIGKLALIKNFFKVEKLFIPVAVFNEIARTKLVKHVFEVKYLQIETVDEKSIANLDMDFDNLGNGEKECIALCKNYRKSLLLTSDKKALDIARKQGVMAINIPAFLLACKSAAFLNTYEISCIIQDLKIKDYYEFSDDMRKRLL
ncbi:MAG: hypothetical protein MPEBLZ_02414 [Candidatus Methanoperedens nitroreducens]|uniref:PIN domain-containing protein n=1 Tax=Candidatus Methanoperedens nitratireducens TaxID=1392998 RepID=A0A0P8C893_9EURY|nr:hypothetical protein [Candidatus Methanoperedens sp. BLZ2]KAB2945340.1 MAG: hypothetical protein F9K14_11055 [Candidatus Methanoperedens sp.]KPQ43030.1 MAG: hypothetical protein MPEBLZ_02414 [Candidatus Methanoperedens sp. BLZ1]MBZ0176551.1 hypothetical protein [Candidatus Methanoperedens nitroreducens]MCX9077869.1 hypothetical protein [Candidatus Methanoperedens sp.]